MQATKHTAESYPASNLKKLILTTQPPYTAKQRTLLQRDILGHALEGEIAAGEELPDEKWANLCERTEQATDEELTKLWADCAEWILSRRDVPLIDNDPVAQAIKDEIESENTYFAPSELATQHPTLIHQLYCRFTESLSPDYGFLLSVYHSIKSETGPLPSEQTTEVAESA